MKFLYYLRSQKSSSLTFLCVIILLISMGDLIFFIKTRQFLLASIDVLACYAFFLLPIFFFKKHLKLYACILLPVILLAPFNTLSIIFFNVPINDATGLLIMNTNYNEALELMKGYFLISVCSIMVYFGLYFLLISKMPNQITVKSAAFVSTLSISILCLLPFASLSKFPYFERLKGTLYFVFPTSIIYAGGVVYKQYQLMNNSKNERNKFTFQAKQVTQLSGSGVSFDNWGKFKV